MGTTSEIAVLAFVINETDHSYAYADNHIQWLIDKMLKIVKTDQIYVRHSVNQPGQYGQK